MAADSTVLKEYLLALGFKVDEPSTKKAEGALDKMDVRISRLAKGALAAATAVQAMVTQFAFQMEKLHYASQRTDSTVGNIKAMEYAFRQLGGSGDQIKGALEGVSRSIRMNPGMLALLETLTGRKQGGRDGTDQFNDLIESLSKMPHYVGAQYAQLFGIDEQTFVTIKKNFAEFKQLQEARKQMAREAGVDLDQASEAGKRYAQALKEIWERVTMLKDALAIALLPSMQEFANIINLVLTDLTKLVGEFKSWEDLATRFWEGITGKQKHGGVVLSEDTQIRLGRAGDPYEAPNWWDRIKGSARSMFGGSATQPATQAPPPPAATVSQGAPMKGTLEEKKAYLAQLELKYGLPPGWLDRVWLAESGRGTNMVSKAGALGHFQFMPKTARQYGLADPMDFQTSADAAGRYYRDLSRMYGGDQAKMAAGYNWGQGNVDRHMARRNGQFVLGDLPAETQGYIGKVVEVNNHISVSGVSDPQKAANLAGDSVRSANNDLVRNLSPGVR